jgi:hypothetical protein
MSDARSEYARLAGEALVAANREADPLRSARLRQQGYHFVALIRERDRELKTGPDAAGASDCEGPADERT